jgi:hypothetical protein
MEEFNAILKAKRLKDGVWEEVQKGRRKIIHSIFSLSSPPFLSRTHLGATFPKLSHRTVFNVYSHTFTLLIEKDICDHQKVSVKLPFIQRSLHFFGKSFFNNNF